MNDKHSDPSNGALEAMLRGIEDEDLELLDPPPEIWDGIEAAVGMREDTPADVVPLGSWRMAVRRVLVGAAAAVATVVIGVGAFLALSDDAGEVLAMATLAFDPASFDALGASAGGEANLVSDGGRLTIEIVDARLPDPGGDADLEVWLIRPDEAGNVADLVSLGVVSPADPESLEVPTGHDPAVYYVVDISVEPRDGDTGHSGRSILRGPLTEV